LLLKCFLIGSAILRLAFLHKTKFEVGHIY